MSAFHPVTDGNLTQSQRADFPESLERSVVDGGVREGRPETRYWPGFAYLVIGFIVLLLGVGLVIKWAYFGFP
jgi:hypothetical protein